MMHLNYETPVLRGGYNDAEEIGKCMEDHETPDSRGGYNPGHPLREAAINHETPDLG